MVPITEKNRLARKAFDFTFSLLSWEAPGNYPRRQVVSSWIHAKVWSSEEEVFMEIWTWGLSIYSWQWRHCKRMRLYKKGYKVSRGPGAESCVRVWKLLRSGQLFATPWTVARHVPLSMESSKQEYWMGCHSLLQGILPTQGLNPDLFHSRQDSLPSEPPGKPLGQSPRELLIFL